MKPHPQTADLPDQRIQVSTQPFRPGELKITLEQFRPKLGWHTSACVSLPIDQLPALEQAIAEWKQRLLDPAEEKIVPFPSGKRH